MDLTRPRKSDTHTRLHKPEPGLEQPGSDHQGNMNMKKRGLFVLVCAGLVALTASTAFATGTGVSIGSRGKLHLKLGLTGSYDTNPAYTDSARAYGDMILNITPALNLFIPTQTIEFGLSGGVRYQRFFGMNDPPPAAGKPGGTTADFSNLAGDANVALVLFPQGAFTLALRNNFLRTEDPQASDITIDQARRFGLINNNAGLIASIKPGGGALQFDLAYSLVLSLMDNAANQYLNQTNHNAGMTATWRFFPRTAAILQVDTVFANFPNQGSLTSPTAAAPINFDTQGIAGLRAQVGLLGQISRKFRTRLMAGYGDTFNHDDPFRSAVASVELAYDFNTSSSLRAGYVRTFLPAGVYGYIGSDRPNLSFNYLLAEKLGFALGGALDFQNFADPPRIVATNIPGFGGSRSDMVIRANAGVDYAIINWLIVGVGYTNEFRNSNINAYDYSKHVGSLNINLVY